MSEHTLVQPTKSRLPAWLRAMRPKQWVKNILVFAAPVAAGALFVPQVFVNTLWAFVAFSLISASIYLINDVRDVDADRQHPKKRFRPNAAGEIAARPATVLAGVDGVVMRNTPVAAALAFRAAFSASVAALPPRVKPTRPSSAASPARSTPARRRSGARSKPSPMTASASSACHSGCSATQPAASCSMACMGCSACDLAQASQKKRRTCSWVGANMVLEG